MTTIPDVLTIDACFGKRSLGYESSDAWFSKRSVDAHRVIILDILDIKSLRCVLSPIHRASRHGDQTSAFSAGNRGGSDLDAVSKRPCGRRLDETKWSGDQLYTTRTEPPSPIR